MKKLLLVLIFLVSVFTIGACNNAPKDTPNEEQDLLCVTGLNGITVCKEVETEQDVFNLFMQVNAKDTLDKTKAPSYMLDVNEEYVSFAQVGQLLKDKYFGVEDEDLQHIGVEKFSMRSTAEFKMIMRQDLTNEEVLARAILFIEELRNYEFYIISSSVLKLDIINEVNGESHHIIIEIPLAVMLNDMFEITLDGIISQDYEMSLWTDQFYFDAEQVQALYDQYVLEETFTGYVLNY